MGKPTEPQYGASSPASVGRVSVIKSGGRYRRGAVEPRLAVSPSPDDGVFHRLTLTELTTLRKADLLFCLTNFFHLFEIGRDRRLSTPPCVWFGRSIAPLEREYVGPPGAIMCSSAGEQLEK